jgi:hypothetical protein
MREEEAERRGGGRVGEGRGQRKRSERCKYSKSDRSRGGSKEGVVGKEEKERIGGRGEEKDITGVRGDAACLFPR